MKELKLQLKSLAVEIRQLKATRKKREFGYVPGLDQAQYNARHLHIAYSMMRGRKYEEIEKMCYSKPDMKLVELIMEKSRESEDVCAGA